MSPKRCRPSASRKRLAGSSLKLPKSDIEEISKVHPGNLQESCRKSSYLFLELTRKLSSPCVWYSEEGLPFRAMKSTSNSRDCISSGGSVATCRLLLQHHSLDPVFSSASATQKSNPVQREDLDKGVHDLGDRSLPNTRAARWRCFWGSFGGRFQPAGQLL